MQTVHLAGAMDEICLASDEGWIEFMAESANLSSRSSLENKWFEATILAAGARILARLGRRSESLTLLAQVPVALEKAPGWAPNYPKLAGDAAEAIWLLNCTDFVELIERNAREKLLPPDFRYSMYNAQLSMARLTALQGRVAEASDWFGQARTVLDEQGARPLRAIVDYDEALMYARRGEPGDRERSVPLLEAALAQFHAIGMPGWIRRAEHLLTTGTEWSAATTVALAALEPPPVSLLGKVGKEGAAAAAASVRSAFRLEGEFWTITYGTTTFRLKHSRGLTFLAVLLREPGREIAATELATRGERNGGADDASSHRPHPGPLPSGRGQLGLGDAGELLDAQARATYKQRLSDLREELAEAEGFNDTGRRERLREEIEFLTAELSRAVGLGGRERRAGSHAERARVNVTRAISLALAKITESHPTLGEHFARTMKTGTFCSYAPDPRAPIEWET
jgi:hypothetical protein